MSVNLAEQKLFELFATQQATNPSKPLEEQTLEDFRAGCALFLEFAGNPADVKWKDETVPARDGYQIPIRIYNSNITSKQPVLVMYPGCGYILDLFEINSVACSRIAKYAGIKIILINFRLAPEHHLPTAIYDGYDATKYIATHADQFNIDKERIFIGGLSSGANCAAVIANLARQDPQLPIYHQILVNGVFDYTESNHDFDAYEREDKFCTRDVVAFQIRHNGVKPTDYNNPLLSPYYEVNLRNLPPTTFIIGEYDGLRNDSEAYYKKVKAAGNQVEKIILPGQTHNTMIARKAMSDGEDPAQVIANIVLKHHNLGVS